MDTRYAVDTSPGLRDHVRVLRRRKWIALVAVVVVPAAALLFSASQPAEYQATAQVLLGNQPLQSGTSTSAGPVPLDPQWVQTQADLATTPVLAGRVVSAAHIKGYSVQALLASSSVTPALNSNLLTFQVTDRVPSTAVALATEYARQFTIYRRELDTAAVHRLLTGVRARIRRLKREIDAGSAGRSVRQEYALLLGTEEQLRTSEALQTGNSVLAAPAQHASQVAPTPVRDGVVGLALGILLGLGLAFLTETLDTRIRSADEIGAALELPLLARLARPPRRLQRHDYLVMLAEAAGPRVDAYRILVKNIELTTVGRPIRTLLVTSAVAREGKSTTAANLAVAFAQAGKQVALVDMDFRRPYLPNLFGVMPVRGITDVVLGETDLMQVLAPIETSLNGSGSHRHPSEVSKPSVQLLPSGMLPPDPATFIDSGPVSEIVAELAARTDVVIMDGPPLLPVSDARSLSTMVDGILLVVRRQSMHRTVLGELHRILATLPADKIGYVLTDAGESGVYGSYGDYRPPATGGVGPRAAANAPETS
jgi:capsular exopolysaccharide synthesis family protein